jgi:small subunit ribosomal protein S6
MLKNYELLYLVHPDLEGSTDKVSEKVAGFIGKIDGQITNQEDWGKRKLAYPVAKNDFGVYILVNFTAESGKVPQVENNLKLSEEILRFMVVALPEAKERPERVKKAAKPKAVEAKEVKAEVKEEKPAKKVEEKAEVKPSADAQDAPEKPKKAAAKKTTKTAVKPAKEEKPKKKAEKEGKAEEAERMKKLDEKLEQILGE